MSLCYDLRFPELYQQLRRPSDAAADKASSSAHAEGNCARGAELLLVPAAFTPRTGEPHWEILLRARAIETQCYIIAAAQAGQHNEKRKSHGHTMVVNPWGTVGQALLYVSHLCQVFIVIECYDDVYFRSIPPGGRCRRGLLRGN
jgi:predicted amidohydrolase